MAAKVFLLGRPGSGKSAAAQRIIRLAQRKNWSTTHISDYEILYKWFVSEKRNPYIEYKYFLAIEHGGFNVIDFSILQMALEEVKRRIQKHASCKTKLVLIEFARDDYSELLRTFGDEVLQDAYFLFLDADIKTCIKRVYERSLHPATVHDHFVSTEIIESYYSKDNKPYMLSQFARDYGLEDKRVTVIDNTGSWDYFTQQIKAFTHNLFEREVSTIDKTDLLLGTSPRQELSTRRRTGPLSGAFPALGTPTGCPISTKS